jgi:hypothetical protein
VKIIARQLQGALAADGRLGIGRERGEPVHLLENTQEDVRRLDTLEATEALIVLVKAIRFA